MGIEVGVLMGLIVLIADVWAIINVARSTAGNRAKVAWIVLVLLLPVFGLPIWSIAGPRG